MGYKILVQKKKLGGSYVAMLPINYCRELDIENDSQIYITVEKYKNLHKEMCSLFHKEGKQIVITQKSEKELSGEISFIDKDSVTILVKNKFYVIPYSIINEIKENETILGETQLK